MTKSKNEDTSETQEHLRQLRKIIGAGATRSLQLRCSMLKIWRRSSPYNWWVENKRGESLWHSSDDRSDRVVPPLDMFEVLEHSKRAVGCYWPGIVSAKEAASPELSEYRLKTRYCPIKKCLGGGGER